MSSEPYYAPGADMSGFVQELMDFVGFTEADIAVIRRSAPTLLKHERAITDALYEHLLNFPAAARVFLLPDGSPGQLRLERRKHSLGRWLRETAEAALTHDFLYYLLADVLSHSHRSVGPGGKIPPHLMVGAMSLAQSAFARIFQAELSTGRQNYAASGSDAWAPHLTSKWALVSVHCRQTGPVATQPPTAWAMRRVCPSGCSWASSRLRALSLRKRSGLALTELAPAGGLRRVQGDRIRRPRSRQGDMPSHGEGAWLVGKVTSLPRPLSCVNPRRHDGAQY